MKFFGRDRKLYGIDSHYRFMISLCSAAVAAACMWGRARLPVLIIVSWDVFALIAVGLAWLHIVLADPVECIRTAKLQDSSRTLIFLSVVAGACASLFAVGYLLSSGKGLSTARLAEHVTLTVATVVFTWFLIHTVFALRYAHIFYGKDDHVSEKGERSAMQFPDDQEPDYMDFAYFSFVIGMTCQVSDVQICSKRVRRLALIHGLLTFLFNTVIVALSINIVSGLI